MHRPVFALFFALSAPLAGQLPVAPPAAMKTIREADLRRDMEAMAGDAMRGREAGTIDEMRASMWVADQMRKTGLQPMGDMGTYFQWWNMRITRLSKVSSSISLNGKPMAMWKEITPTSNAAIDVSAPTIYIADPRDTTTDVRGKIVVTRMIAPPA